MQEVHADKVLMLAIGNNDYISYNKLFDRYYGRLCQYVYSLLMDRNDAEDVVQELFLNLSGYDPESTTYENTFAQGVDFFTYPKPRTFTFGVNLSF